MPPTEEEREASTLDVASQQIFAMLEAFPRFKDMTVFIAPRSFSFSCLREIRCIWNVRQRYNRQLPLLETSVNGFQQHLRAAVSAACDRGCCCATSGLCCLFLACLLPRQQEG